MKRLELDFLQADLAAVRGLLAELTPEIDPIGAIQFSERAQELERQIAALESAQTDHASVALFFGGRPVVGSHGIMADFAGKALEQYQEMVVKRFSVLELGEPLSPRGAIPKRNNAQMMVTQIARGSFGFILEEANDNDAGATPLKRVVSDISDLISRLAQNDEEGFASAAESLDGRLLLSVRAFFKNLDDAGATMKLVDDQHDFELQRDDIHRARQRAESIEVTESECEQVGMIFLLPDSNRFEFLPVGAESFQKGTVAPDLIPAPRDERIRVQREIFGALKRARFTVREVRQRNRPPRLNYILVALSEP